MIRQALADREPADGTFRLRGREVTRIEALSDAVFGFGITLLVMSVEPPTSYANLVDSFRGLPAFAACFAVLAWMWHAHYAFCRRYGLTDPAFIILNTLFLFVVVFYIYPLKFVFVGFLGHLTGLIQSRYINSARLGPDELVTIFVVYGLGFAVVFLVLGAMYAHAYGLRKRLELNPLELAVTRAEIVLNLGRAAVGGLCALMAVLLPRPIAGVAGFSLMLLGPLEFYGGLRVGRAKRRHGAPTPAADRGERPTASA